MFKIKRPAIIGLLVVLLVFTGYLNYYLTQQAQRKSSKDYQNHELMELAKNEDNQDYIGKFVPDPMEHVDILNSAKTKKIKL